MQEGEFESATWNYQQGISNYLEIENYIKIFEQINSKKRLHSFLSAEELGWETQQRREIMFMEMSIQLG